MIFFCRGLFQKAWIVLSIVACSMVFTFKGGANDKNQVGLDQRSTLKCSGDEPSWNAVFTKKPNSSYEVTFMNMGEERKFSIGNLKRETFRGMKDSFGGWFSGSGGSAVILTDKNCTTEMSEETHSLYEAILRLDNLGVFYGCCL